MKNMKIIIMLKDLCFIKTIVFDAKCICKYLVEIILYDNNKIFDYYKYIYI